MQGFSGFSELVTGDSVEFFKADKYVNSYMIVIPRQYLQGVRTAFSGEEGTDCVVADLAVLVNPNDVQVFRNSRIFQGRLIRDWKHNIGAVLLGQLVQDQSQSVRGKPPYEFRACTPGHPAAPNPFHQPRVVQFASAWVTQNPEFLKEQQPVVVTPPRQEDQWGGVPDHTRQPQGPPPAWATAPMPSAPPNQWGNAPQSPASPPQESWESATLATPATPAPQQSMMDRLRAQGGASTPTQGTNWEPPF